ncbi:hypothetical protein EVG20_g7295 [Dentipellis fragilis]|uniref:Uncharacterized protein n=1 Tax=Dentipellis fragilis TaxID=205917 RepID=A0A4Y9YF11_9AGAM|nr:hypothetical protein EVG20_g7295 [Dentipellis fragilis]
MTRHSTSSGPPFVDDNARTRRAVSGTCELNGTAKETPRYWAQCEYPATWPLKIMLTLSRFSYGSSGAAVCKTGAVRVTEAILSPDRHRDLPPSHLDYACSYRDRSLDTLAGSHAQLTRVRLCMERRDARHVIRALKPNSRKEFLDGKSCADCCRDISGVIDLCGELPGRHARRRMQRLLLDIS